MSQDKDKKVTLYVPCYNAERYVAECLQGILEQTYPIDEILVIDDGSTDRTVEIASRYPVKIIRHGVNRGLGAARNTAFDNAKNEYVAALDADCVPEPDWLEALMRNFKADDIAGVGGKMIEKYRHTLPDKFRAAHLKQNYADKKMVNAPGLCGANVVFTRTAVRECGFYDERFRTNHEDNEMAVRIRRVKKLVYEPSAAVHHIKRDTIKSVLRTHCRWNFAADYVCGITGTKALIRHTWRSFRVVAVMFACDLKNRRGRLIPIDFLVPFVHLYYCVKACRSGKI